MHKVTFTAYVCKCILWLKVTRWRSRRVKNSVLRTRTTTAGIKIVPTHSRAHGGTGLVIRPTSTGSTWVVLTNRTLTAWIGMTGLDIIILWRSARWKSDLSACEHVTADSSNSSFHCSASLPCYIIANYAKIKSCFYRVILICNASVSVRYNV